MGSWGWCEPGIGKNRGQRGDSKDGLGAGLEGPLRVLPTARRLRGSVRVRADACGSQQRVQPGSGWSRLQLRDISDPWPGTGAGEATLSLPCLECS